MCDPDVDLIDCEHPAKSASANSDTDNSLKSSPTHPTILLDRLEFTQHIKWYNLASSSMVHLVHVPGQRIDQPQQIKSGDPCCVQELHQNACSVRRQCTSCGLPWSDVISIGPRLVRRGSVRIKLVRTPMTSFLSFGVTLTCCTWFVLLCLFEEIRSKHMFQFDLVSFPTISRYLSTDSFRRPSMS